MTAKGDNWRSLGKSISRANGKAVIIVHPFFAQEYLERVFKTDYAKYKARFRRSIGFFGKMGLPFILLEEGDKLFTVEYTISKMDIIADQVYVVPTEYGTPQPNRPGDRGICKKIKICWLAKSSGFRNLFLD